MKIKTKVRGGPRNCGGTILVRDYTTYQIP